MKYLDLFENMKDFSQFNFPKLIESVVFYASPTSPELLKLIFMCGGKVGKIGNGGDYIDHVIRLVGVFRNEFV